MSDEREESVLAHISSRQGPAPPGLYEGEDNIVYFLRRLNISPGVLDYVLKDTERTKGSRKCSCHCDLHLSSLQLCFKESHLNTQYISSPPASDPIWEMHS